MGKLVFRDIKSSLGRWIAIFAIIALGAGFLAGLVQTCPAMLKTISRYVRDTEMYDWRVVLRLAEESYYSYGLAVVRPNDAWRAFLEARLPAGEDLLSSPFLGRYAEACVPDGAERFEKTCARLLGDAASGEKAKNELNGAQGIAIFKDGVTL